MPLGAAQKSSPETEAKCAECPIRLRSVCSLCQPDEFSELERIKIYRSFQPGDQIAWAGEAVGFVGSVVEGVAMLSRTLADGRRQMVGLLMPSDFLGRPGRTHSAYDVVAATEITFCMFHRSEFEKLLARNPRIERRLLEMTLDELDSAREWMVLLGRKTAREKIATLLVNMARRDEAVRRGIPGESLRFPLHMTREAMADYLGLTIETVSRQITRMRQDGVIALEDNRVVQVPNLARLIAESGDDPEDLFCA